MNIEEKAIMIAEQCKPCTDDFYSGIKQGVILALNAEESNLKKAEKWDELEENVSAMYIEEDEDSEDYKEGDLGIIGEMTARAMGFL